MDSNYRSFFSISSSSQVANNASANYVFMFVDHKAIFHIGLFNLLQNSIKVHYACFL